jgi:nucleoredoxin
MIVLIDATTASLTVSWPVVPNAIRYILQFRRPESGDDEDSFQTLSDHLTGTQARKRNLDDADARGFIFRVRAVLSNENEQSSGESVATWTTHPNPFFLLTPNDEKRQMAAPQVFLGGTYQSARVTWLPFDGALGYELQMRENAGGEPWQTIASNIAHTEIRKKNLTSTEGYQFRVRQLRKTELGQAPFSPPSDVLVTLGISDGVKKTFQGLDGGSLIRRDTKVALADALGGKEFILLYASAHWCGPCRQFTPVLAKWYQSLAVTNQSCADVVFLSCDHDESGFKSYYSTMPWLAVDFEDSTRERLLSYIRVSAIPRLVVVDGRTGRIVVDNAVGQALDVNQWRKLADKK